jgi:protein arginine kinase activator
MGNSQKCDLCKKPATVHLTQIVNNQIHKLDLCEECAAEKGVTDPNGFSLADLLVKSSDSSELGGEMLVCENCGFTQKDFKKTGRLGCPECYEHFAPLINPVLRTMHKGDTHKGKVPEGAMERKIFHEKIHQLEGSLQLSIKEERYEDAAKLRDELQAVRETMVAKSITL